MVLNHQNTGEERDLKSFRLRYFNVFKRFSESKSLKNVCENVYFGIISLIFFTNPNDYGSICEM